MNLHIGCFISVLVYILSLTQRNKCHQSIFHSNKGSLITKTHSVYLCPSSFNLNPTLVAFALGSLLHII